jgi:hypothetical protein
MTRLLVLWTKPIQLPARDMEDWVHKEAVRLHDLPAVSSLALTQLSRASDRHARLADWLLEIELADHARSADCVEAPLFAEWFGDMRQMGMRPSVMLADGTRALEREDG